MCGGGGGGGGGVYNDWRIIQTRTVDNVPHLYCEFRTMQFYGSSIWSKNKYIKGVALRYIMILLCFSYYYDKSPVSKTTYTTDATQEHVV